MEFEFYAVTHAGLVRDNNEDYCSIPVNEGDQPLAIVADGMGGHKSGEVASKMAVETFAKYFCNEEAMQLSTGDRLLYALKEANTAVFTASKEKISLSHMGTTFNACYVEGEKAFIVNVGDSRAYHIRNGQVIQVTQDHSMVQELIMKQVITPDEAINHPQKNIITRAIGIDPEVIGDLYIREIASGDYIMLCSDGLTSHVNVDELGLMFDSSCTLESIANTLKDLALMQGGSDNVTIVVIRCN